MGFILVFVITLLTSIVDPQSGSLEGVGISALLAFVGSMFIYLDSTEEKQGVISH